MSEHIKPEQSMALMALAEGDPGRHEADAHAASCASCRAHLHEGQTLLNWVDAYAPLPSVNAALKARVRQVVLTAETPAPWAQTKWGLAFGMLLSVLLALLDGEPGGLSPRLGLKCLLFENMVAVAPFALAAYLGVRGRIPLVPLNLAAVSMAGALVGQVILTVRCEAPATPHVFAFHVVGVALATALGYAASVGLLRMREP